MGRGLLVMGWVGMGLRGCGCKQAGASDQRSRRSEWKIGVLGLDGSGYTLVECNFVRVDMNATQLQARWDSTRLQHTRTGYDI